MSTPQRHSKGKEKVDEYTDDEAITLINGEASKEATILDTFSENSGTLLNNESPSRVVYNEGSFGGDSHDLPNSNQNTNFNELMEAQMSQLQYNNNRLALDRVISTTIQLLMDLSNENSARSIFYPLSGNLGDDQLKDAKSIRALMRKSTLENLKGNENQGDRDIQRDKSESNNGGLSSAASFNVLNLDIKMIGDSGNLVSNLDQAAISKLLDEKIQSNVKHLFAIRKRIDDTSSKVFVTGDLNSGKSTFCNALLRKKLLPEDQQPCTSVFSEVIDSRENDGLEEVHAVPIGSEYNRKDESTFEVFQLSDLEYLVGDYDKYAILKVYVNDKRPLNRSLLRNGVIDIKLIDAPGLNMDSYQTTEVFSRQEEIDLVVFVVSAENHFTLSAREFITAAAKEKQFIFIVVNKFDSIKNKDRCMKRILSQVQSLSPETHKDARDFVHFVSSSSALGGDGPGDDSGGNDNNGVDDSANPHHDDPDFDHLESSLRKFVLEKRALSKLAPAKNFLIKILSDLEGLSVYNEDLYAADKLKIKEQLDQLIPFYNTQLSENDKINKDVTAMIEAINDDVYQFCKKRIGGTVSKLNEQLADNVALMNSDIYKYANQIQTVMINEILKSIEVAESYAKKKTIEGVNKMKLVGQEALHDESFLKDKVFREDFMFQRKRHHIIKNINREVSLLDFIDPSFDGLLSTFGIRTPSFSGFSLLGRNLSSPSKDLFNWKNSLPLLFLGSSTKFLVTKNLLMGITQYPTVFKVLTSRIFVRLSLASAVALGVYYLVTDMPNAFRRKYSKKLQIQLNDLDYVNNNSMRISKECHLVLQYPAKEISRKFDNLITENFNKKQRLLGELKGMDISIGFYKTFSNRCKDQKKLVESFDLESIYHVD
ncbi:mitofusin [Saccharomycopsis crataegensis]|uniref:Mitofusin n=1 Tax=Saccharomycopsis crataegensis TaxID=43959 RepID=A0AAV5QD90_9ASCO|nr:mitofusin [Saccharomycopsis crataegensis]